MLLPSSDAAADDKPAGTSPRKGPRRATAPAGAPAKTAVTGPALLVIGVDGMIVPTSPATPTSAGRTEIEQTEVEQTETGHAEVEQTETGHAEAEQTDAGSTEAGSAEVENIEAEQKDAASPAAKTTPQVDLPADDEPAEDESAGEATAETAPPTDPTGDAPAVGGNDAASAIGDSTRPGSTRPGVPDEAATTENAAPEAEPEAAADTATVEAAPAVAGETVSEAEAPTASTAEGEVVEGEVVEGEVEAEAGDAAALAANEPGDKDSSPLPDDTPAADASADDAAPLSRRERRLAEQRLESDVEPGDNAPATLPAGAANGMADAKPGDAIATKSTGTAVNRAKPVKKRNRFVAFIRGLFFLVVISALVVGMGTVLSGNEEAAVGPSQTEQHRQAAWLATTALLSQTTALASTTGDPKIQDVLARATKDLAVQAAALGDGLPPNTATPTPTATPGAPPTAAQLAVALTTSGGELLTSSLTAEHAMGRVFAAAGTSQLLLGQNLSTAAGSTAPATTFLPARIDFTAPDGPACKSTLEPRPGASIDAALRAAALSEQKAVYAYQVSTTRFAEPQFGQSAALLQRHQAKLEVLNAELRVRCLPLATPVAGFDLDPSFTTTPKIALAGLEADLSGIYADLAALSTALPEDSAATAATGAAAAATPQPANTTNIREIAVTWLLDSAQAQDSWGGSPAALAGMPVESAPAGPAAP